MSEEAYVEIEQVAEHFKVSVSTIRTWIRNGQIPRDGCFIKIGKTYRFKLSDADKSAARLNSATASGISATETQDISGIDSAVGDVVADLDEDM